MVWVTFTDRRIKLLTHRMFDVWITEFDMTHIPPVIMSAFFVLGTIVLILKECGFVGQAFFNVFFSVNEYCFVTSIIFCVTSTYFFWDEHMFMNSTNRSLSCLKFYSIHTMFLQLIEYDPHPSPSSVNLFSLQV